MLLWCKFSRGVPLKIGRKKDERMRFSSAYDKSLSTDVLHTIMFK